MLFFFPMWDTFKPEDRQTEVYPFGFHAALPGLQPGCCRLSASPGNVSLSGYRLFSGSFHSSLLWLLAGPFALGMVAQIMYMFSWHLAYKKGFEYDYDKREASWMENGTRVTYHWSEDEMESSDA